MIRIELPNGEWEYDPATPLGPPGGFGAVFAGRGEDSGSVAVKKLHLTAADAAHRELRIADELLSRSLEPADCCHSLEQSDRDSLSEHVLRVIIPAAIQRYLQGPPDWLGIGSGHQDSQAVCPRRKQVR